MNGEVWLDVAEIAVAAGVTPRAVRKRASDFVSRKVPGIGRAGERLQVLLSSLPAPWQAAYWQRVNALPLPWQDAVLTRALPAPAPEPLPLPLSLPLCPSAPVPAITGACPFPAPHAATGSGAPMPPQIGVPALSSSNGGEDSAAPVSMTAGAAALSSPDDDTTYIKEWQRDCLHARLALLQEVDRRRLDQRRAVALAEVCAAAQAGQLPPELQALVPVAVARGETLSPATLRRWLVARHQGLAQLAPKPVRVERIPAWGDALLKEWQRPQKPTLAVALAQLAQPGTLPAGVAVPSYTTAWRFLQRLDVVERHRGRLGPRALRNLRPYRQRDASGLWPLEIVSMDGHTFDAEVAHPFHGQPFRPEITSAIDIATRRLVGWSVALAESALAVLDAVRHTVQTAGIPAILYVDHGSGYHNALMEQQAIGFMARLGITKVHSLPFNSQARGAIERSHRTVWNRLAKTLPTYLGDDMDQEARNRVYKLTRQDVKRAGHSRLLPTWPDFVAACERAVAEYNARPHHGLPKILDSATGLQRHQSPDEAWAELIQQNPDCLVAVQETELADLFRPYRVGQVTRGAVRIFNNVYFSSALSGYHGETVFIGYDLHDASQVWIRDRNQRLIGIAALNGNRSDYQGQTALEHAHAHRAQARKARLERHLDEVELELQGSRPVLEGRLATPAEVAAAEAELAALTPLPPSGGGAGGEGDRPTVFHTDLELWRWVEDHPDQATAQDRAYLAGCLADEGFQALVEMERQKKSRPTTRVA